MEEDKKAIYELVVGIIFVFTCCCIFYVCNKNAENISTVIE